MILRGDGAVVEAGSPDDPEGRIDTVRLSDAGGLRQFGAYLQTIWPGASTGEGHWHSAEDEFLYVTEGTVTVIDDDGAHDLSPGDAAVWRAGIPNAHRLANRSGAVARYVIAGSRIAGDVCSYPGSGRRQVNHETTWEIVDDSGNRIKGGDLPPELLGLAADWTVPPAPGAVLRRIVRNGAPAVAAGAPERDARAGAVEDRLYSEAGGLQQFEAFTRTLQPGSRSPVRRRPEAEDLFLYMLDGAAAVTEGDGPDVLQAGDAACWPAGVANGQTLTNRSAAPCTCLVIGSRRP